MSYELRVIVRENSLTCDKAFKFTIMDKDEILKMSPAKRILLAQEIWDSVPENSIEVSDPIKDELNRRLASHKRKEMVYYTPEEVRTKLAEEGE